MIRAISYCLPEMCLTNDALAVLYRGWTADKIFEKTGIQTRHVTAADETGADLAEKAARNLFEDHQVAPASVDFILFCTQSPDYALPTTACILQHKLGIPCSAGALDFNLGCSGYVYGLGLSQGLISAKIAKRVLLLTGETYTKYIHPMDKSVRTIFGDGGSATLVEASDGLSKIGNFTFGTDGRGADNLIVQTGGARKQRDASTAIEATDESGNVRSQDHLFMNGPEIFSFTLDVVPKAVESVLNANLLVMADIDLFVFHQANKFMLETLRKRMRIPCEKFYVNMADCGNTVSSTIPIALARAEADGSLKHGMKVMLVGFGVGLSWGATVVTW